MSAIRENTFDDDTGADDVQDSVDINTPKSAPSEGQSIAYTPKSDSSLGVDWDLVL